MPPTGYPAALAVLRRGVDVDLQHVLTAALAPLQGHDPVVYLVDFAHRVLMPMPVALSGPILVTTVVGLAIFLVAVLLSPETKGKVLVAELTVA